MHATTTLLASALLAALTTHAAAQAKPPALKLLSDTAEIRLALTAAPEAVSGGAGVHVLRRGGFVRVKPSQNGFECFVDREHPESLGPVCYDSEGARTIMRGYHLMAELREKGQAYPAALAAVYDAFNSGRIPKPTRPVMSYMVSQEGDLHIGHEGPSIGPWKPHMMIFWPGLTNKDVGPEQQFPGRPFVQLEGTPLAHLVIVVPQWSNGKPAS